LGVGGSAKKCGPLGCTVDYHWGARSRPLVLMACLAGNLVERSIHDIEVGEDA
jgi:hypothetical protein